MPEALLRQLASQCSPGLRIASAQQQQRVIDQRKVAAQQAQQQRRKQRRAEVQKGPVTVKALKHTAGRQNSAAAVSFLKEQLQGARTKRSIEMLRPTGRRPALAPAARFVK